MNTKQEYALLLCGEFFRDEIQMGAPLTERQEAKFQELRDLAFAALGDPSMKDADEIRARHAARAAENGGQHE